MLGRVPPGQLLLEKEIVEVPVQEGAVHVQEHVIHALPIEELMADGRWPMVHGKRVYTSHVPSDDSRCLTQTSYDTVPFTPFVQLVTSTPMVSKRSAMSHQPSAPPVVAIIGRPNVGKSTLINPLLGQQRTVVVELPGTTRDSDDTNVSHQGRAY